MRILSKIKNLFKKSVAKPRKPAQKARPIEAGPPKSERFGGEPVPKKKDLRKIYKILKEPHISEKSTQLSDRRKYTFKVYKQANKNEIKKAIGNLYKVKVEGVSIINIKPKKRVLRGTEGRKSGYKKAIVTLAKGEKIEILPH